jgi:hypothetical protein
MADKDEAIAKLIALQPEGVPKEILDALEQERDKLAFEIEFLQKELVEVRLPACSRAGPRRLRNNRLAPAITHGR